MEFLLLFNEFAGYWMLGGGFVVRILAGLGNVGMLDAGVTWFVGL